MRLSSRWNRLFSRGDTFEKEAKRMTRIEANEQQPEQRPIGKACSDESDVQSAAILKEVKSRIAHRLTTWSSLNEREVMWCLLQLTETIEGMLQREVTRTNT